MLEVYYIFTSLLLYQGFAVPLSSTECNGIECDDVPDCSKDSCQCIHPSGIYCNAYYICKDGFPKKFSCSPGLLFDEDNLTCDYEDKVDCKNRTQVPPLVSSTQQVSTMKDLDLQTTIKYTYLSDVETTPIAVKDPTSTQTDNQETTDSNSTLTTQDNEETRASADMSTTNATEISTSTTGREILSSTQQTNTTNQQLVSDGSTLETTDQSQVSDEDTSETTDQNKASDEDTSKTTDQSKVSDEDTSETTDQSKTSDADTSKITDQSQVSDEDTSITIDQSKEDTSVTPDKSKVSDEVSSETTNQSKVTNDDTSETTNQSPVSDEDTSETADQRQISDKDTSETTDQSKASDEDTSETTHQSKVSDEDTSETTDQSKVSNEDTSEITNQSHISEDTSEITDQSKVSADDSSETTNQSKVTDDDTSEATNQSQVTDEDTSKTTDQRQISDKDTSDTTNQSKVSDEDTSETTDQSKVSNEDISETTNQSQVSEDISEITDQSKVSHEDTSETIYQSTDEDTSEKPITEKPTTLSTISTDTEQNNITLSTTITLHTSPDSFTKQNNTISTLGYISTQEQPSEETTYVTEELVYNFTCTSRFGLFPDLENCNYFYQCSHFLPYHMQCPSDLHFNAVLQVCDWPYDAGCEKTTLEGLESSTSITSTKIFSSTFLPTNTSFLSSTIASTSLTNTASHEIESTSDKVSSTTKNITSSNEERISTESVTQTYENSTDIKTMGSKQTTTSIIEITTTDKANNTQEIVDMKTTLSISDNLTNTEAEVASDSISPNDNITLQPQTDNDEASVNTTNSSERTIQFESSVTDSLTTTKTNTTEKTYSTEITTIKIDLTNITETILDPQTKTDSSEITNGYETSEADLATKEETIENQTKIFTEETNAENGTTSNPELTTDSVETSNESEFTETHTISEVETMETEKVTTFENITENNKLITNERELETTSRKTDFESTETITDLQSTAHQNNFTTSTFEILSTQYNTTSPDHNKKTVSTGEENITSTNTVTQELVTLTKSLGSTSSVPLVNISIQSTNEILVSTTNVSSTDDIDSTTETLPEETSSEKVVHNFTCASRFGLFPDPENCNYFYQCSHFIPYHLQCPSDLHFNPILEVCDWPYEAGCEINSTDSSKETDKDFTQPPETIIANNISSTSEYQTYLTDKTTKVVTISPETASTKKEASSESDKILTSTKPIHKPNSTAAPDETTFNEATDKKISDYSTSIVTNSTQEAETEITSTYEQEITAKDSSDSTNFTNSTKEAEIETGNTDEQVFTTKNGREYNTIKFTNSTNEVQIETTVTEEQEFVTKNNSHYSTIKYTNFTNEVEIETTNSDKQELTTKNTSDYSTVSSTNSTKEAEIITTLSELQELTSKPQTIEIVNVTKGNISTNVDTFETTYGYRSTREKATVETTAATSFDKESTIKETEQPVDFECMYRFGLYPDLKNCSKFYQCSQFVAYHMDCPPELHFNPILQVCDWPIDAGCVLQETSTNTINEITTDFDCPSRFGLFPDINSCSRFFQCSQWISYPKECSPGLHFNAVLKVCDSPFEAGCDTSLVTHNATSSK